MAVALTTLTAAMTGTAKTLVAVDTTGHTVPNADGLYIEIVNANATPRTVTFVTTATYRGYAVADATGTAAGSATTIFGPFPTDLFGPTLTFSLDVITDATVVAVIAPRS